MMKIDEREAEVYMQVSLSLFGNLLDPEQVTNALGVFATKSWRKGDKFTGHGSEIIRKTGLWSYKMKQNTKDLTALMDDFFGKLPMRTDLRVAAPNVETVRISIFVSSRLGDSESSSRNLNFSAEQIQILARSGAELGIDVISGPEG